ncbi:MAG: hypothetical protein E3J71_10050 [Candidatus Stahlbacteria bacterium]|nr:MAG: hypothetical protein E3J71_10050 [Candidatus Stahlbacteria bacterium]
MGKRLAIGVLLVVYGFLGGCVRAISTEEFRTLEKQVIGTLILDAWENLEDTTGVVTFMEVVDDTNAVDSLVKAITEQTLFSQGYSLTAFYEKAKELGIDATKEIISTTEDALTIVAGQYVAGAFVIGLTNLGAPEAELDSMLEFRKWAMVDTLCRKRGYLPPDYEERIKQHGQ